MSRNVLLIGSIPLGTPRAVFDAVGATLDGLVRRIPDGENGERLDWVAWQSATFARIPFVDTVEPVAADTGGAPSRRRLPQFRVRPGFPPTTVRFGSLGYLDAARRSFADFSAAKKAGTIPPDCRLLVGVATPLSVVGQFVDTGFQAAIEPSYERALVEEIDAIAADVPQHELAIQWNLATELCIVEGHRPVHFGKVMDGVLERLVRLCERVPADTEVGLHFCYDDFLLNGFPMPDTLDRLVDLANGVLASAARPIAWVHLPVRHDVPAARYLAPLRRLMLPPETELYLGLLHPDDGIDGAARRIALARREVADFGIACACGFGRVSPEAASALLDLHRRAAAVG